MITLLLALTGVALLVAGPTMLVHGLAGRRAVARELTQQRIHFPDGEGLPDGLGRYAGAAVHTGGQARAFSSLIAANLSEATGGRTYAEIVEEWMAGNRTDDRLARLRQTAFMGQILRGSLLGAYQAWQLTLLVMALGVAFTATGAAFLALALHGV